ncbi:hypothetical protein [Microcoleus sp. N9_A1]|uniref:hypothetical protein n=1 Tax=Microcoleus sp. N9_A1 TaxID=3055380 RepID=UPI002FD071E1
MFIELDGIEIELDQIPENWHLTDAAPGDWRYSLENGTYWGICKSFSEAITTAKRDIAKLMEDFNFTANDLAREWQSKHGIDRVYFVSDSEF